MPHRFDTSNGREVFETAIGVGKVIKGKYHQATQWKTLSRGKGWDIGVLEMSVGERCILTISR